MLYDNDGQAAEASRHSPVAKSQRSPEALAKSATGRTSDGAPVHSFQSLLADLATLARNTVRIPTQSGHRFRFDAGHGTETKPATIPR